MFLPSARDANEEALRRVDSAPVDIFSTVGAGGTRHSSSLILAVAETKKKKNKGLEHRAAGIERGKT